MGFFILLDIYIDMGKFIITEEDRKLIRGLYGLINEGSGCNWENYINGDGITRPKITIDKSESGVIGTYEGPETGVCIQHSQGSTNDSLHQLVGVIRKETSNYLKELYNQGVYVYPDLENIVMTKRDKYFSINVPFNTTTEDKAITNFNERGGWGHDGKDTFKQFLSTISDATKYGMITTVTKIASGGKSPNITENWVSFRDISTYPIVGKPSQLTPQPSQQKNKPETIEVTGINSFQEEVKAKTSGGISIDVSSVVFSRTNSTFKVSYSTGETKIDGMTLMIDETSKTNLNDRIKNNILLRYPNLIQKDKWKGEVGKWYYEFLILIK
jgi:hypothetical protein